MVTKETENITAEGSTPSTFQPNERSVLFNKETSRKFTLSPTETAIKKAQECIEFLPADIQQNVTTGVLEIFNTHHEWMKADATHTKNVNDPSYLPKSAKWKSSLQPSRRVIHTVGYKRVEASLNKVVEQCKEQQKQAALALQLLDRYDKRDHTIRLAWNLLMKLTESIIKVVLQMAEDHKPAQILVVQAMLKTIRTNKDVMSWYGMFGCQWGKAFLVLEEITKCENTLLCDPSFVSNNIAAYRITGNEESSDLSMPATSGTGATAAEAGTQTEIGGLPNPPSDDNLDDIKKQLSVVFQTTGLGTAFASFGHKRDAPAMVMNYALRNRKTEIVRASKYMLSLKVHLEKFLNALVLEEDDPEGNAAQESYNHRGLLVCYTSTVKQNNSTNTTTQNGATSAPSQSNTGESTLVMTGSPTATTATSTTATSATASTAEKSTTLTTTSIVSPPNTVIRNEETPGAPETQKTPNTDQSPPTGEATDAATGESVEDIGNGNEDKSMKDPLSDIDGSLLEDIVSSVSDAINGLIHHPYCAYDQAVQALKKSATLVESFIESDYVQKTEEALELVLKDKRVTPPILNEAIQRQIEPVKKDVEKVKKQTIGILSKTQKRNQKKKEAKKRKKLEAMEKKLGDADDVEADPDTETEQQRKKSKNSDSHPETAPSVTQKKNQNTDKNGKGKQGRRKRNGKQQENDSTPTTPTQRRRRKSKKQSEKKNGGK